MLSLTNSPHLFISISARGLDSSANEDSGIILVGARAEGLYVSEWVRMLIIKELRARMTHALILKILPIRVILKRSMLILLGQMVMRNYLEW